MLDAFIIDEIKRKRREREKLDRSEIQLPLPVPEPLPQHPPQWQDDETPKRGVIVIDL